MPPAIKVTITGKQEYPIYIDHDLSSNVRSIFDSPEINTDKAICVIDSQVDSLHHAAYASLFENIFDEVTWFVVPQGEKEKNIENFNRILDFALSGQVRRNTPLLAVGGGVTGDLAGYAASSIMRGLPLYHFPTTLLAMVDSSIGGKTGINHKTGKNLIGAFYQPKAIFVETKLLETLPEKEWLCGLGEVLKYAAISDPDLFEQAGELITSSQWHNHPTLKEIITDCIGIKTDIVRQDEKESGIRAFLNLGHTFAHALEAFTGYEKFSHGEAVFIGLIAATHLSSQAGGDMDVSKLLEFKQAYRLRTKDYISLVDKIVPYMYKDKKNLHNKIRLVLLTYWGEPFVTDSCSLDQIKSSWKYALENVNV